MSEAGDLLGVVLAGGLGRRMGGGDKGLRLLAGRRLLDHVVERAKPQVEALALNANGPPQRFAAFGLPVVPDSLPENPGPLAGVLAGMDWAVQERPGARWLVSFACDAPFFPRDLASRLLSAATAAKTPLACAASQGRTHPVFGLWHLGLREDLRRALAEEGLRKVDLWTERHGLATVDFPPLNGAGGTELDPFFNANRPEDLAEAERLASLA